MFGISTLPVALGALATGIVFSGANIAIARNPSEKEAILTNSLIAFALVETFVVIGLCVATVVSTVL